MKTFSKRYKNSDFRKNPLQFTKNTPSSRAGLEILTSQTRMRLNSLVAFLVSTGDKHFEPFLLKRYNGETGFVLDTVSLRSLSIQELGYDITEHYDGNELVPSNSRSNDGFHPDAYFLDLIELLLVFSLEKSRKGIVSRIQYILDEESASIKIHGHMIIRSDERGLRSIIELLKDDVLREKLNDIINTGVETTTGAKQAADVTQHVFSSEKKGKTKSDTEKLISKIADRWVGENDKEGFENLLNALVKDVKNLNNEIKNVRHTDKSTIELNSPDMYKMIRNLNLAVSELAIMTTQEDFIEAVSAKELKEGYFENYNISNQITEEDRQAEVIDLSDIPF